MKKFTIITILVLALLAVSTAPAYAAGIRRGGSGTFAITGTIVALDAVNETVTIKVTSGNTLVRAYVGTTVVLLTTDTTRILLRNPDGPATVLQFSDLAVGDKISASGKLTANVFTASRITKIVPPCLK